VTLDYPSHGGGGEVAARERCYKQKSCEKPNTLIPLGDSS
jgi:hypothetical protein